MHAAGDASPTQTAATQRQWREAQAPPSAYGSRVRHSLRGRWFHLVPMSPTAMMQLAAAVIAVVGTLVGLNHLVLPWASSGQHPAIVSVLQLNHPGSLGSYVHGMFLLATAGVGVLIYQLRRYRNDDFRGEYRLWRSVVIASMLASFAAVVPIVGMFGELLEWGLGQRVALSGSDWVSLLITLGAIVLALRTLAELRRARRPLMILLVGWLVMAVPVAARFNVIVVDSAWTWSLLVSAPLVASACWFLACTMYLRRLYADVRGIDSTNTMWNRMQQASSQWMATRREAAEHAKADKAKAAAKQSKPSKPRPAAKVAYKPTATTQPTPQTKTQPEPVANASDATNDKTPPKRRWWSRKPKNSVDESDEAPTTLDPKPAPSPRVAAQATAADSSVDTADETTDAPKKRRFGLGGFLSRRSKPSEDASDDESDADTATARESAQPATRPSNAADEADSDDIDESDIDWSSMSKAERRRVRKQLKRGGRAA